MREIKFRAWDSYSKKMESSPVVYPTGWSCYDCSGNFDTLMQYTGVKDKNGVEIYEGDIITHSHDGMIGIVCWSEGLYRFVIEKDNEIIADLCDYDFEPEVIGNIYENPEVLK